MLKTLLESEGHVVEGVHSGDAVMPLVRKTHPDVVILDIAMPGQSGFAVARELGAADYPGRKPMVIAISGRYVSPADRILSELVGFDHHLIKPYEPQELLDLLKLHLRDLGMLSVLNRPPDIPRQLS